MLEKTFYKVLLSRSFTIPRQNRILGWFLSRLRQWRAASNDPVQREDPSA